MVDTSSRLEEIAVELIDTANPRQDVDEGKIQELAASVEADGLLQPILVRPSRDGRFTILDGERRFRAVRSMRRDTIRAFVRDRIDDVDAQITALVANLQREDLTAIDEALAYDRLRKQGMTAERIAERISKSKSHVSYRLQLLDLPAGVQVRIQDGTVSATSIRAGIEGIPEEYKGAAAEAIVAQAEAGVEMGESRAKHIAAEVLSRFESKHERRTRGIKDLTPSKRRKLNDDRTILLAVQDIGQATQKGGGQLTMTGVLVIAEALVRTSPRAREALSPRGLHGRVTRDVLESETPEALAALSLEIALLTVVPDPEDAALLHIAEECKVDMEALRADAIQQIRDEVKESP